MRVHILSWAFAVAAGVAGLTAAVGLVFNFWVNPPSIPWPALPTGAGLVPRDGGPYRLSDGKPDHLESSLRNRIYIHVRDLNLASRQLEVQVSYALPFDQGAGAKGQKVSLLLFEPTDTGVEAQPATCGERVPAAVQQIQISDASSVFSTSSNASVNGKLPIKGDPASYPTDAYSLTMCAAVQIGDSAELLNNLVFLVQAEPELQDHELYIRPTHHDGTKPTELLSLHIERNGFQQGFSYAMAVLPLLIMVVLCVAIFVENPGVVMAVTGVAATVLTILPLRQVLIPAEVSSVAGVTRVDYLLGLELSAMVVVFMIWMARRHPTANPTTPPEGHQ